MKEPKKEVSSISIEEALKIHEPFTREEADKIVARMDKFYERLRKEYGGERFDLYTSTIQSIAHPDGMLTNLRGNMHAAQVSMANALNVLIDSMCNAMKLPKESVLLYCITDLGEEVRKTWKDGTKDFIPKKKK